MKRKKILYVHHGGAHGGAPRSLSFLIKNLDQAKYQPYALIAHDYADNKELFETVGAEIIYEPAVRAWHGSTVSGMNLRMFLSHLKRVYPTYKVGQRMIQNLQPDLVHLNSSSFWNFARGLKKADKNIPILCHIREPLLPNVFGGILQKGCEKYVDAYVAIEQYDLDSMKNKSKPEKVVYNFVDFEVYNNKVKSSVLRDELEDYAKELGISFPV